MVVVGTLGIINRNGNRVYRSMKVLRGKFTVIFQMLLLRKRTGISPRSSRLPTLIGFIVNRLQSPSGLPFSIQSTN